MPVVPTTRRPTRTWPVVLGLTTVVVVVAAAILFHAVQQTQRDNAAQRVAAVATLTTYLQAVQQGDAVGSYRQLCGDSLHDYTEADHARFLAGFPSYVSFQISTPTETTGMDGTDLDYQVRFVNRDGTTSQAHFDVELLTSGPRVCDGPGWRED